MAINQTTANENLPFISQNYVQFPFVTRKNDIKEDYKITGEICGIGINGKVYKCLKRITKQKCALKLLQDSESARREVILHKKACENCPYIVQIIDVYETMLGPTPCLYVVMEQMEGGELFNRIQDRPSKPYTERDAANFISMIVKAVTHLHSMDIAHRDLKPENLLFTTKENDAILKLCDFGFAKEGNNERLPLKTPCCTPYYVAPEIISQGNYDKACDIWSMGVIMYILLCGYPPFYSVNDSIGLTPNMKNKIKSGDYSFDTEEWSAVSQEAKSIIKRMLTVKPEERITINEILNCSWFNESVPERLIDMSSIYDVDNWKEIQTELASAIDVQRVANEDEPMDIPRPEQSNIVKKRQAQKHKKK